ncbi:MAG: hypothetical protein GQ578_08600 [Desulfuromonadaceae bacterium]|nr:hypothetical protein [Desulfuromonadaceae bacterium]
MTILVSIEPVVIYANVGANLVFARILIADRTRAITRIAPTAGFTQKTLNKVVYRIYSAMLL